MRLKSEKRAVAFIKNAPLFFSLDSSSYSAKSRRQICNKGHNYNLFSVFHPGFAYRNLVDKLIKNYSIKFPKTGVFFY